MSPRPKKPRRCHCPRRPAEIIFKPAAVPLSELQQVILLHDEIEALLLCDERGLTQAEAGRKMDVSRGTVQRLVTSGRKKLIGAIFAGHALVIQAD